MMEQERERDIERNEDAELRGKAAFEGRGKSSTG